MDVRVYHSLEEVFLKDDDFLQNCIPLSKTFDLEVIIRETKRGLLKQGTHLNASFTCKGDFTDCYALLLLVPHDEPLLLNSLSIENMTLVLTPPNWEYNVQFPHVYNDYLFLWHKDMFETYLYKNDLCDLLEELKAPLIWQVCLPMRKLFASITGLFEQDEPDLDEHLEMALDYFVQFYIESVPKDFTEKRSKITAALAFDLLKNHHEERVNVAEVCNLLKVSRRSLEISYKAHFGISPGRHLKQMKLFSLRKSLLESHRDVSVSSILSSQNIRHWGHFGNSYKSVFGENMKDTLKRSNRYF